MPLSLVLYLDVLGYFFLCLFVFFVSCIPVSASSMSCHKILLETVLASSHFLCPESSLVLRAKSWIRIYCALIVLFVAQEKSFLIILFCLYMKQSEAADSEDGNLHELDMFGDVCYVCIKSTWYSVELRYYQCISANVNHL